jgi:serine/threonine protein kinase
VEPSKTEKFAKTVRLDERLQARRHEGPGAVPSGTLLVPGSVLGNYEIVRQIGEGGMGVVYQARDTVLDRTVALKILPPHLVQNPDFMHRFRTEAHAQARLQHPNIVTLFSMLELPAGFVLVMEYVEGQTLLQRIRADGPLDPAEAIWIFEQALQAVAFAHQMGVVHRDLKPDNIFITAKHEIKIMDFGVAKILDNKEPTRSRSMVGTLLYISPEQINGGDADFRSDIYTLGISLFETVTGRLPFERKTDYGLMHAHILENPPRPRHLKGSLPKELEKVILKAIEKEPARRFQSASDFRTALLQQGERFGLELPATANSKSNSLPAKLGEQLGTRNRALGGIGFDVFLIAAVVTLVLALGLYPGAERPQEIVEPVKRLTVIPDRPTVSPAEHATRAAPQTTRNADPAEHKMSPPRDRYDSLRKAWGG